MLLRLVPVRAEGYADTVDEVQSLIDGIIAYKLGAAGAGSVQDWISGEIAAGAGTTSDWYAIALSQNGTADLTPYRTSLEQFVSANAIASATSQEKAALALAAAGSTDPYIEACLDGAIGQQGIMSWIYGLHVLNNGYTCGYDTNAVVGTLLSLQYPDGGWALFGEYGDIDVTAMTMQALAPQVPYRTDVQEAVNRGIDFLSQRQKEDGGYQSFGTPNPESAAQVLVALSALGIDGGTDPRFLKGENNLLDGIVKYRLPDGSFSHTEGGGFNETATTQAFYALIAYQRMQRGQTPLLIFDRRQPVEHPTEAPQTAPAAQTPVSGNAAQAMPDASEPAATIAGTAATAITTTTAGSSVTSLTTATTGTSRTPDTTGSTGTSASQTTITTAQTTSGGQERHLPAETGIIPPAEASGGTGYQPVAVLVILGAGGIACLVLFLCKRRHVKNFLFVGILTAAGIAVVLLTDIRSTQEYYSGAAVHKEHPIGTVTLSIRCDTVVGKSDAAYIPADGVMLPETVFEIEEGDTVFDILTEAAQTYGIQVENAGSTGNAHGMVYIAGIGYLYEFAFGDLSGWVYHVNGITPSRGCGEYVLSDGDCIEWLYTCELGHDLNEVYEE